MSSRRISKSICKKTDLHKVSECSQISALGVDTAYTVYAAMMLLTANEFSLGL